MLSTVSDSTALVLLTEAFNLSRSVGSGSFLPKSEIIRAPAMSLRQDKIVAEGRRRHGIAPVQPELGAGRLFWVVKCLIPFPQCLASSTKSVRRDSICIS